MQKNDIRNIPLPAIKEELGGGFYYRCPFKDCNKVVRSEWVACPYCGALISFDKDSYTKEYYTERG